MKHTLIFIGFVLAVLLGLYLLSSGKQPPSIPQDLFHAGVSNNAACLTCHTPGRQVPLKESHPPKTECLICHKFKK